MFNPTQIVIEAFITELRLMYERTYTTPSYPGIISFVAQLALETIATSDAAYHDINHTIMVTLVGQEILRGRHISVGSVGVSITALAPNWPASRARLRLRHCCVAYRNCGSMTSIIPIGGRRLSCAVSISYRLVGRSNPRPGAGKCSQRAASTEESSETQPMPPLRPSPDFRVESVRRPTCVDAPSPAPALKKLRSRSPLGGRARRSAACASEELRGLRRAD